MSRVRQTVPQPQKHCSRGFLWETSATNSSALAVVKLQTCGLVRGVCLQSSCKASRWHRDRGDWLWSPAVVHSGQSDKETSEAGTKIETFFSEKPHLNRLVLTTYYQEVHRHGFSKKWRWENLWSDNVELLLLSYSWNSATSLIRLQAVITGWYLYSQ